MVQGWGDDYLHQIHIYAKITASPTKGALAFLITRSGL
ncbi:hypothetical protein NGI13_22355 [Enterobacter asburiae]|nr:MULTISPECIES: hypothetical protein [Enterobacter]MEB8258297.1 hypothetical protein [Enterobacter asburiae]